MSGGSMDYICYRVEEAASMCEDAELAELLQDAAKVLHDEEWWRSCDYNEETYRESLAKFKAKWFKGNRDCRYFPICSFTENYADPDVFYTWGEKKEDE